MKKKLFCLLHVLLALAIVCSTMFALPITASTADYGGCGDLTWTLDEGGTLTISGTGEMERCFHPNFTPWDDHRKEITAVIINEGVTDIASFAFYGCTSLKSITVPDGVESIEQSAFEGCTSLTDITLPDGVTYIGHSAFDNTAYYNDSANWTENVLYIGNHLIKADTALAGTYSIREGTITIAGNAFKDCTALTAVTIPDGALDVGYSAFDGCTSLTEITLPDSVKNVGRHAFDNTAYYNDNANWTENVLYIGNHLIKADTALAGDYSVREGTKTIAVIAFIDCKSLTGITFSDGVTGIGESAFYGCSSLKDVTLPDCLTSISDSAFTNCVSLTALAVPSGVKEIKLSAFRGCTALKDVTISNGVTIIGEGAFSVCESLENITIPDSVTNIEDGAFSECTALTNITIPDGVTKIGNGAFSDCTSLTNITIPDSVTSIGFAAFRGCTALKGIVIPKGVTNIDKFAFTECDSYTIYGNAGSYAQTYATENNIPFVAGTKVGDKFFTDIVSDEWYVSAVQYALDNKLFFGVSDTEFAPNAAMNRAMLVTVLWRSEGKPEVSAENTFTDVPAGEWYTDAVLWAAENDVVYGTGENEFSPKDNITREDMAAILYRYAEKKGFDLTASTDLNATFPDGESTSEYARDALSWACGSGLIFGSDGKLLPQDGATRAQVAAILMRYMEKVVQG